ncbi:hypothetical protein CPC08DRAFT_726543 [Agrocybe pediades]|nr:hypothetical protein CPC08DRAFT_726543 [Agrocybe pediades]
MSGFMLGKPSSFAVMFTTPRLLFTVSVHGCLQSLFEVKGPSKFLYAGPGLQRSFDGEKKTLKIFQGIAETWALCSESGAFATVQKMKSIRGWMLEPRTVWLLVNTSPESVHTGQSKSTKKMTEFSRLREKWESVAYHLGMYIDPMRTYFNEPDLLKPIFSFRTSKIWPTQEKNLEKYEKYAQSIAFTESIPEPEEKTLLTFVNAPRNQGCSISAAKVRHTGIA